MWWKRFFNFDCKSFYIMKFVVSTFFLLSVNVLCAQDSVRYYLENGEHAVNAEAASYYRVVKKMTDGKELHTHYWLPSKIKKKEGHYVDGKATGLFKTYYRDGSPNMEIIYGGERARYIQIWSQDGKPLLRNGTGYIPEVAMSDWEASFAEIEDSLLVYAAVVRPEKGDTIYSGHDIRPQYPGGDQELYEKVRQSMVYPPIAQRMGIEGTLILDFLVNKSGALEEITVIRGLSVECDHAAMNALSTVESFSPAIYKGKPVKVRMRLPIGLRLEEDDTESESGKGRRKRKGRSGE
jgi:TonB family protein